MDISHKLFFIEANTAGPSNDMLNEIEKLYNAGWYLTEKIDISDSGTILILSIPKT